MRDEAITSVGVLPLTLAGSIKRRARGLLFSKQNDEVLLLMPCHDIHTFGMKNNLDIAFVDTAGYVMETHYNISPSHRFRCKGAAAVLERFASSPSSWFEVGDFIGVARIRGGKL